MVVDDQSWWLLVTIYVIAEAPLGRGDRVGETGPKPLDPSLGRGLGAVLFVLIRLYQCRRVVYLTPQRISRFIWMALVKYCQSRNASGGRGMGRRSLIGRWNWDHAQFQETLIPTGRHTLFQKVRGSASDKKATKNVFLTSRRETLKS